MKTCECGCGVPVRRRFIKGHAMRVLHGSYIANLQDREMVAAHLRFIDSELALEFSLRVLPTPDGCCLWKEVKDQDGYGIFQCYRLRQKQVRAHRFSYQAAHGVTIAPEVPLDHIVCSNRSCCNPFHVVLSTPRDNTLRSETGFAGINFRKTHCKRGHALVETNLYKKPGSNARVCRECRKLEARSRNTKRRLSKSATWL